MKVKDGFIVRKIADKYMAVPIGSRTKELHGMIALNETAAFLWEKMEIDVSEEDLVKALFEEYEVSKEDAAKSVSEFIESLKTEELVDE